jgi:WD40 repeat protein
MFAAASADGTVTLWDSATWMLRRTLQTLRRPPKNPSLFRVVVEAVLDVAWSPDGNMLALASHYNVEVWDTATGAALRTLRAHSAYVCAVIWSPDGKMLASASWDKTVKLWDPVTQAALQTLKGHSGYVHAVAWSPDGKVLASASEDNTVRLWNLATEMAGAEVSTSKDDLGIIKRLFGSRQERS